MYACFSILESGWNSLERLPRDTSYGHETIYLRQGFLDLMEKTFVNEISYKYLHLNTIVKRVTIDDNEDYVHVDIFNEITEDSRTYRVQHVVCTQSVGCLKQSMHQLFVPPLPHAKRMSIQRLGFGTMNKVSY
jgi:hypothetical protein